LRPRSLVAVAAATVLATPPAVWAIVSSNHPVASKYALASLGALIGLTFIASGVVARTRRPDNRTGWLMIAVGFGWYLSAFSQANNPYVFTAGSLVGALNLGFLIHLVVAFPSGRLESRAARVIATVGYVLVLGVNAASVAFSDLHDSCGKDCPRNVALVYHDERLARAFIGLSAVAAVALACAIVVVLVRRWRRASVAMRRALLPVFVAGAATLAAAAADLAAASVSGEETGAYWVLLAVFLSVPLAFLFGLLRSRLTGAAVARVLASHSRSDGTHDTEHSLRDALGDPSLELAFWYAEGLGYVDTAGAPIDVRRAEGRHVTELTDEAGVPLAAVIHDVALLDEPHRLNGVLDAARLGLQRDRLHAELRARVADVERERDFFSTVANMIPTLLVGVEPDGRVHPRGGNRAFAEGTGYPDEEAIGRFLWDLVGAEADLRAGILDAVTTDSASSERESVWRSRDGREITVLWTCTPLPSADDETPIFGVAALDITARKSAELQLKRSRSRLVAAAGAERRRLERNLHDGAQQRLVSVSLTLRLAQSRLRTDPDASAEMLDDAANELTLALEELRELARGLHPAVLAERGLEPALTALAERAPVPVEIDARLDRRPPEPVEVALFYVVSESLTNVAKYAQASLARVEVRVDDGVATVEISYDGVGGALIDGGTGLRGLSDRIEALDGTLTIESPPGGGTTVRASVPLTS